MSDCRWSRYWLPIQPQCLAKPALIHRLSIYKLGLQLDVGLIRISNPAFLLCPSLPKLSFCSIVGHCNSYKGQISLYPLLEARLRYFNPNFPSIRIAPSFHPIYIQDFVLT